MQIQINSDRNVEVHGALTGKVEAEIETVLERFNTRLTRIEVHLADMNSGKSGSADKRCLIEARPSGQQPVSVTHCAATLDEACTGAVRKLERLLQNKFDRLHNHKGAASLRDSDDPSRMEEGS